jgi:hypothetical protein
MKNWEKCGPGNGLFHDICPNHREETAESRSYLNKEIIPLH